MSVGKGVNNFKKIQQDTIKKNLKKIEISLSDMRYDSFTSISNLINCVSKSTGLHFSTIYKSRIYYVKCEQFYLTFLKKSMKYSLSEDEDKMLALQLENSNLKNQILLLNNTFNQIENISDVVSQDNSKDLDYQACFFKLIEDFYEYIDLNDEIFYNYSISFKEKIIFILSKNRKNI